MTFDLATRCRIDSDSLSATARTYRLRTHAADGVNAALMPRLTGLCFAYPDVAACDRAPLVDAAHTQPVAGHHIFVLSTCLRVELVWPGPPETASLILEELYGPKQFPAYTTRTGEEAFHHLARIAAGLDSVPVGETEVLAQFRQALKRFEEDTREAKELGTVLKTAIGVGRAARRALDAEPEGSLATAAAKIAGSAPKVAVLGSGAMARAVIAELDDPDVAVYARKPGRIAGIPTRPWSEAVEGLATVPAVISTVPGPAFDRHILAERPEPLLFVDLGMPPAFESSQLGDSLDYRGVDDVAALVQPRPATEAERVASREAAAAWQRLTVSERAGSIINSVVDRADQTVDEEVQRFASRLTTATDPETVLRQLARTVARRILHPSVAFVGSTPLEEGELDVVARAFGVDND